MCVVINNIVRHDKDKELHEGHFMMILYVKIGAFN